MAENSQAVIPDNLIIVDGEIGGGVPSSSPSDAGKVLTVDSEGDPSWVTPSGGTQYSEGNGIDISNENVISVDTTVVATQSDLSGYQPTISDLETIRSGAAAGATAVQPGSLATVATSGSYADLSNKPSIPTVDQVYNAASANAQSGVAVASAVSGKQDTISDLETIRSGAAAGATAVQPSQLATVATTGSYADLSNKPSIPAAQVNADWNAASGVSQILNKPSLATVATSGSYADLSNKPSIPAAQVQSDWNQTNDQAVDFIKNKPNIPAGVVVDQTYSASSTNAQSGVAVAQAIASVPTTSYTAGEGIDITANEVSVKAGRNLGFEPLLTTVTLQSPTCSTGGGTGYAFLGKLDAATVALLKSGTISLTPKYNYTISMTGVVNSGARFAICQSSGYNVPYNNGKWLVSDDVLSESGVTSFTLTADTAYTVDFSTLSSKSTGTWTDVEANPTSFYLVLVAYSSQYTIADLQVYGNTGALTNPSNPGDTSSYSIGDPTDLYLYAEDQLPSIAGKSGKVLKVNAGATAVEWSDESTELPAATSADNGKVLGITDTNGTLDWVAQTPAQVNADWNASSGVSQILNKPTIPAAQVNSDWNAASGVSQILNKPSLATVATSGSYNDLTDKPSIPAAQIQSDWDQSDDQSADFIKNKPSIPAAQVNSDWNAVSGVSQILNKPTIPTVDQSYSASSTNAQSGVAVAGALATVNQVPASTSADEDKVLTVNSSGVPEWATAQGGGSSYTAGAGIDITSDVISAKIDNSTLTTDSITTQYAEFTSQGSYGYNVNLLNTIIGGSLYQQDTKVYTFHIPAGGLELAGGVQNDNIYPVLYNGNSGSRGEYRVNQKLNATVDSNTGRYTITGGQTFKVCFSPSSPYFPVAMRPDDPIQGYYYLSFASFDASQIEDNAPSRNIAGANSSSATIAFDYRTSGTTLSVDTDVVQPKLTAGNGIAISDSNEISVDEGEEVPITSSTSSSYYLGAKLSYNHLRIYFHKYNGSSSSGHLVKDVYESVSFTNAGGLRLSEYYNDTLGTTTFSVSSGSTTDELNVGSSNFSTVSGNQIYAEQNSSWVIDKIIGFNDSPFASQS